MWPFLNALIALGLSTRTRQLVSDMERPAVVEALKAKRAEKALELEECLNMLNSLHVDNDTCGVRQKSEREVARLRSKVDRLRQEQKLVRRWKGAGSIRV